MTLKDMARQTMQEILLALHLPASEDTQNAVTVLIEVCWNHTENVDGEEGNAHRGTFAGAIIRIIRINSIHRDCIPAHDLVRLGDLLWDKWCAFLAEWTPQRNDK